MHFISRLTLITIAFGSTALSVQADQFTDDFNRPDSSILGNGWQDTDPGQTFGISNDRAILPYVTEAGFYRPFSASSIVQVSATFTQINGFNGLQDRYGPVGFSVFNDGTIDGGYTVTFYRGDQNYNDSEVTLTDGAINLGSIPTSFQFGPSISATAIFSQADGVTGSVTDGTHSFQFTFAPHLVQSSGSNVLFRAAGPDARFTNLIYPTIDDVSITSGVDFPHRTPSPLPDTGSTLGLATLALLVVFGSRRTLVSSRAIP